jgi:hypothetical protein
MGMSFYGESMRKNWNYETFETRYEVRKTQTNDTIERNRAIGSAHSSKSDRVSDHRPAAIATGRAEEMFMSELLD